MKTYQPLLKVVLNKLN